MSDWISVKDSPKENGMYLCSYFDRCVFKGKYRDGKWQILSNEIGSALWNVTHWQAMQQPPEQEGLK